MLGGSPACVKLASIHKRFKLRNVLEVFKRASLLDACVVYLLSCTFLQSRHTQPEPLGDHLHQRRFLLMFHILLDHFMFAVFSRLAKKKTLE